ncbi:MAG: hypothetical protein U1F52_22545 [Burkholderiales bacterium]
MIGPPATSSLDESPGVVGRRDDPATRLLPATVTGDPADFEHHDRRTARRLLGPAAHLLRDRARAEDVLQEAVLTIDGAVMVS